MSKQRDGERLAPLVIRAAITVGIVLTALLALRLTGLVTVEEDTPVQMVEAALRTL